jgi:hypothetical protein
MTLPYSHLLGRVGHNATASKAPLRKCPTMIRRLFPFLRRESKDNVPPALPYRCGTMLLRSKPEQRKAIFEAWRRAEEQYVAWVEAHPRPKREWVEIAAQLRQMHQGNDFVQQRCETLRTWPP